MQQQFAAGLAADEAAARRRMMNRFAKRKKREAEEIHDYIEECKSSGTQPEKADIATIKDRSAADIDRDMKLCEIKGDRKFLKTLDKIAKRHYEYLAKSEDANLDEANTLLDRAEADISAMLDVLCGFKKT